MSSSKFRLIAAPVAPFHEDGRVNLGVVEKQAALLTESGVDGAFVNGTTGECASLRVEERIELAARWVAVAGQFQLDVLVQVGDNCQSNAVQLAAHAREIGAKAIAAHAPSYFRPQRVEELISFLAPIASAARDLPFYYYEIPSNTGVHLPMVEFLEKAPKYLPNLVGLKYSNADLVQLQECIGLEGGRFQLLFGYDELLLAGVALGAHGAIGGTYNFAAPLYRGMLSAWEAGEVDVARRYQRQSVQLIRQMQRYGFGPACKEAMRFFGVDCGPPRLPLRQLAAGNAQHFREQLERLTAAPFTLKGPAQPGPRNGG